MSLAAEIKILSSMTGEERILTRHIIDLAKQADNTGLFRSSNFLDERQQLICSACLNKEGYSGFESNGGFPDAERRVILFHGYGEKLPFTPVVFNYRSEDRPSHRDFLGSLMALEIKREMIGDILVGKSRTVVFVMNSVLPLIEDINKIGRTGVKISYDFCAEDIPAQECEKIDATVKSLRLDSVLSAAIRLSREKTQELIKSRGVTLNHVMIFEPNEKVDEGDVFSVRGMGKFCLEKVGGISKKERIFITIQKYK